MFYYVPDLDRHLKFVTDCLTFLIMSVTSSHWHAVQLLGRRSLSEEHGRLRNNPFSWSGMHGKTSSSGKGTDPVSPP
jgi:hypothetical protein